MGKLRRQGTHGAISTRRINRGGPGQIERSVQERVTEFPSQTGSLHPINPINRRVSLDLSALTKYHDDVAFVIRS